VPRPAAPPHATARGTARLPSTARGLSVDVQIAPAPASPGDTADVLVLVTNSTAAAVAGVEVGLVLPPGIDADAVTPPVAVSARWAVEGGRLVVRCSLPLVEAGGSTGMDVTVNTPTRPGRHVLTAFATVPGPCAVALTEQISLTVV
jgi:hypothetical protein